MDTNGPPYAEQGQQGQEGLQELQDDPATPPPREVDGGDVEYVIEADGDDGWEALKGTVDIPLDDMQWALDKLPPSMRKVLRLVLFDNYRANFT